MPKCEHTDFRFHPGIVVDLNSFDLLVRHPNICHTVLKFEWATQLKDLFAHCCDNVR